MASAVTPTIFDAPRWRNGDVAQLGERGLCKPEVAGSIPVVSTMSRIRCRAKGIDGAATDM